MRPGSFSRAARDARDRQILDDNADELNREMEDVLAYQALRVALGLG
jgi:hypothetical protein